MRKRILAALVVAAGVTFVGYNMVQSQNKKSTLSDLLLDNVEALAGGEVGTGFYKRTTSKCPPPVEYKTAVSCSRGGSEECNPSDC